MESQSNTSQINLDELSKEDIKKIRSRMYSYEYYHKNREKIREKRKKNNPVGRPKKYSDQELKNYITKNMSN